MNTVPLQKPVNQKVPLLQNQVLQKVPLQASMPVESIKPMFTPDEAKALSAEAQAKLNSAEWLKNYKQMMEQSGPEVSDINMRDQIAVAMRDPVYGQATATGLAAGQNMLNSWIAGANSKSRANREKLANERWIKQMQDADEDRQYNRRIAEEERKYRKERDALSDKRYNEQAYLVGADPFESRAFVEQSLHEDPAAMADIELLNKTEVYNNAVDAAKARSKKEAAKSRLNKRQELATPEVLMKPKNELESTRSFGNLWERGRGAIFGGWGSPILMDRKDAANAKMMSTMAENKYKKFSRFSLQDLEQEIQNDKISGRLNTAVQKQKILNLMQALQRRGFRSAAVSPDGQMFVFASPSESVTITPNTVDRIAKEFEVSVE